MVPRFGVRVELGTLTQKALCQTGPRIVLVFRMAEIGPPDIHHLSSAIGWLELGNPREALCEWERISQANSGHSDVLEAGWRIRSAMKSWAAALELAHRHVQLAPDHPAGWINQSFALHEMKRTQEAYDQLFSVAEKFSKVGVIPYNLACYACQLGNRELAEKHLAVAVKLRGNDEIKQMALADPDLKPMREYIDAL